MPFFLYTSQEILMSLPRFTGSQEKNTALPGSLVPGEYPTLINYITPNLTKLGTAQPHLVHTTMDYFRFFRS